MRVGRGDAGVDDGDDDTLAGREPPGAAGTEAGDAPGLLRDVADLALGAGPRLGVGERRRHGDDDPAASRPTATRAGGARATTCHDAAATVVWAARTLSTGPVRNSSAQDCGTGETSPSS